MIKYFLMFRVFIDLVLVSWHPILCSLGDLADLLFAVVFTAFFIFDADTLVEELLKQK